jgi:hypothetical protein
MFTSVTASKTVIVLVPSTAVESYTGNTTWQYDFTGGSTGITLKIEAIPEE